MTTVPKDAFTDRIICIEPTGNIYVQKALGSTIRRRLKRWGVDLDDQTRNQDLAREGSISNGLCTIDLSSASDSISLGFVKAVLPQAWFTALTDTRSTCTQLPCGTWRKNEKFSSMGNGFTFELESALFYAILLATTPDGSTVSVFGDDLVAPASSYAEITVALSYFGFTPNMKKSYGDGPFRESCGKHYFNGEDVTPVFQKKGLCGKGTNSFEAELYAACNRLVRWQRRIYGDAFDCDLVCGVCAEALRFLVGYENLRFRIPDGFGDGGLVSNSPPRHFKHGVSRIKHLRTIAYTVYDPEYCYWSALRAPSDWTMGRVSIRRSPTYKVGLLKGTT
jgi:hypothetical protein